MFGLINLSKEKALEENQTNKRWISRKRVPWLYCWECTNAVDFLSARPKVGRENGKRSIIFFLFLLFLIFLFCFSFCCCCCCLVYDIILLISPFSFWFSCCCRRGWGRAQLDQKASRCLQFVVFFCFVFSLTEWLDFFIILFSFVVCFLFFFFLVVDQLISDDRLRSLLEP